MCDSDYSEEKKVISSAKGDLWIEDDKYVYGVDYMGIELVQTDLKLLGLMSQAGWGHHCGAHSS